MTRGPSRAPGRNGGSGASDRNDGSGAPDRTDGPGDRARSRNTTRRSLLATAVASGAGLATVGLQIGEGGSSGRPSPGADGGGVTGTAAGDETERAAEQPGVPAGPPVLGANLNGRPHRLLDNLELIDASDTTWVRAFLDVRRKLADGGRPADDPDVLALRRVARERNCRLVVSLKWDFRANWGDKAPIRVPPPGSRHERELYRTAAGYLAAIGEPVSVVVLGNEPLLETLDRDIRVDDPPIVRFTRGVKDHLVERGDHGDPAYLVGAFNRVHDDRTRERLFPHFHRQMFELAREADDVDGIDLHVHYDGFEQAERAVAVAREAVPDGVITATEFSPVWRYYRYKHTPITDFEAGERFAADYGLPAGTTAVEYFERAKRDPRPPEEVAEFYDAMPWYDVNHVENVFALFADYDVGVGTIGFLQDAGMRTEDWTTGWLPFHVNFLFQPALIRTGDGIEDTAHPHYIEDYRERTGGDR